MRQDSACNAALSERIQRRVRVIFCPSIELIHVNLTELPLISWEPHPEDAYRKALIVDGLSCVVSLLDWDCKYEYEVVRCRDN